jgi:C1A family cysteine protease/fibronectin type 3 domain-containing protein
MKKILISLVLLGFSLSAQSNDNYSNGLKPDPYDLVSSLKEANPHHIKHRGLPASIDLSEAMPPVGNQGQQGSCVGWATSYANKSYLEFIERKGKVDWNYTLDNSKLNLSTIFSPSFIYNQINGGNDNGSSIFDAMTLMVSKGAVPWDKFPYDEKNFRKQPSKDVMSLASKFKSKEFKKVRTTNVNEIKALLAEGKPVTVGVLVDEGFNRLRNKDVYSKASGQTLGGHAITIVGYNDSNKTLKFINSWGTNWGDKGYGYIDYTFFTKVCRSAFVMYDIQDDYTPTVTTNKDDPPPAEIVENDKKITPPTEIHVSKGNFPDKIALSWSGVKNAIGYEIYRAFAESDDFQLIGLSHNTYFEDTGVIANTAYAYKLTSVTEFDVSEKSAGEVIGYSSESTKTLPTMISGLKASIENYPDKVALEWEPLENIEGYNVYKWNAKSNKYVKIQSTKSNSYEDSTAQSDGIAEFYFVNAYNSIGEGDPSEAVMGKTSIASKPAAPKNLVASRGEYKDKIELNWEPVKGARSYNVFRYDKNQWENIGETKNPKFIDKSASPGLKYYSVIGLGSREYGSYSNYALGFTNPFLKRGEKKLPPPKDIQVKFDQKNGKVHLSWSAVPKADEYNVWVKKAGTAKWNFLTMVDSKSTSFDTEIPEKNSFYLYSITSKTMLGGDSEYSAPVSAVDSIPKKSKRSRSFSSTSRLEKIAGTWSALQWDGQTGVKNVVLEIEKLEEDEVQIKINNDQVYKTKYVNHSDEINFDGKVKIKLDNDDALSVVVKDKKISKSNTELSFLRE